MSMEDMEADENVVFTGEMSSIFILTYRNSVSPHNTIPILKVGEMNNFSYLCVIYYREVGVVA